jgi:hypothetical protein
MSSSAQTVGATRGFSSAPLALALALALLPVIAGGCAGGATVRLGDQSPRPYHFAAPQPLPELGTAFDTENPTLTDDLLEIYFTSNHDGVSTDVWSARRGAPAEAFSTPTHVDEVSTPAFETSAAVSGDGLTLWVGSDRAGGLGELDIWMSTRSNRAGRWSAPVNLLSLNATAKDVPRPPGQRNLVMPLASERDGSGLYRTYLSARANPNAPFGSPSPLPELVFADKSTVDGFLTDDGLTLFFSSSPRTGPGDLFVAWRRSTSEPFSIYAPLDELNTTADDRDPWLSRDGKLIFFSSSRDGLLNIYQAAVLPR